MAYGRQLLERHTLVPDHTLYSWTQVKSNWLYCSWVAELFFYSTYKLGGLPLIFAFRYAVVLGVLLLAWGYAGKVGLSRRPAFWAGLSVFILASYVGTIIKPELFSFAFLSLSSWLFFRFKLADWRGEKTAAYLIAQPLLMCLWANTHGVYVFGLLALGILTFAEILNFLLIKPMALRTRNFQGLIVSSLSSLLFVCCTPYGISNPLEHLNELTGLAGDTNSQGVKEGYKSIAAHMTIFQTPAFHFQQYLLIMSLVVTAVVLYRAYRSRRIYVDFAAAILIIMVGLIARGYNGAASNQGLWPLVGAILALAAYLMLLSRRAQLDAGYGLVNLAFGLIYIWYLRTTYYWPAFFLYSTLFQIHAIMVPRVQAEGEEEERIFTPDPEGESWSLATVAFAEIVGEAMEPAARTLRMVWAVACFGVVLFLCGRGAWEAKYRPYASSWCGFGITYWNPVVESEFIEKYHPDIKILYNDYDSGGWLIWKMYPRVKVMIDPRGAGLYSDIYADYIAYERGQFPLAEFHKKFTERPDVSIVSLKNSNMWRAFLRERKPDGNAVWVPAFVGPSSVVFCHPDHQYPPDMPRFAADRFEKINNSQKALQVYQFGIEAQLFSTSWEILDVMRKKFTSTDDRILIDNLEAYKECILALSKKDLEAALSAQERCRHIGLFYNNAMLVQMYQYKLQQLTKVGGKTMNDPDVADVYRRLEKASKNEDPL